jgi:ribulose-5-phosphate 4-epimerase/fuculose-1-phosphate aldolase
MSDQELKEQLAETTIDLYHRGCVTDKGGNLSIRSVDHENALWITPSQINKCTLTADSMVLVDFDGKKIEGEGKPSVESVYHAGLMRLRKDINAVVHTHAPLSTAFGVLDFEIPPVDLDAVLVMGYPKIPFAMAGSKDLANAVFTAIGNTKVSGGFLCNHGMLTVGKNLQLAAEKTLLVEHVLKIVFAIKSTHIEPKLLPEGAVKLLRQFADVV